MPRFGTRTSTSKGNGTLSLLHNLGTFLVGPWLGAAAVKRKIGYDLLGIGPFGVGKPDKSMDTASHRHAVKAIYRVFGDDPFWCVLVATSVYIQNCRTAEEIDSIVSEHAESRTGAFPAALYHGQGWDPGRALWFLGDRTEYRRAYLCPGGDKWITSEHRLDRTDRWRESGYKLEGRRGCVTTITFNQGEDERQMARVTALEHSFALGADRLIRNACGTEIPGSLRDAIHARTAYNGVIGPADVTFAFTGANRQDWTNPPTVNFILCLKWRPPASPTVDSNNDLSLG
jgi:hypothetical protein